MEAQLHAPASQDAKASQKTVTQPFPVLGPLPPSATVAARGARPTLQKARVLRVVVPVRYHAWLTGDLGRSLERTLEASLGPLVGIRVTRMQRALLVEAEEATGPFVEAVERAVEDLERAVKLAYPVFHHQFGPVWTGTLQTVFAT